MNVALLANTAAAISLAAPDTKKRDSAGDTPGSIQEVAGKFEALLIGQLLKTARQSASEGSEQDQSAASLLDMADEHFADLIAAHGGLGLARMVTDRLSPTSAAAHLPGRSSPPVP